MTIVHSRGETPSELKGKWSAVAMCWIFGLGTFLSWNVISTLGDYFYEVFPDYHPERVLTIVYAPLSIALVTIFLCKDTRRDTIKRHLIGYVLFCASSIGLLVSYVAGLSASGALTSVLRLITKAAFENAENGLRKGALLFLAISIVFQFQCAFFYAFVFPNLPVVKYYRAKAAGEGSKTIASNLSIVGAENGFDQHVKISLFSFYEFKLV
ncbi:equilibrative nucleotide transporter 3 [Tanacetum coccineum]